MEHVNAKYEYLKKEGSSVMKKGLKVVLIVIGIIVLTSVLFTAICVIFPNFGTSMMNKVVG